MFSISHTLEIQKLSMADKDDYDSLIQIWEDLLRTHPTWSDLMAAAACTDYREVSRGLTARFD